MIAEPAIKADPVQEAQYDALESRILEAIRSRETAGEASFDALALAVYRFQVEWNAPYANYGRAVLGGAPVERWQDIPAVPQQAFKRSALRTFPEAETARTFRTSGTTGEGYGSHHFRSLRLYEASILAGWRHFELPAGRPQAVFTPRPEANPHSSLGHMMGVLGELAPPGEQRFFIRDDGSLDVDGFLGMAAQCTAGARPILLLGTALAFLHLCEALERRGQRVVLPAGSEIMETGGYKGTGRTLAKAELYERFTRWLGLPAEAVINEYGMTELSTPFYTRGLGRPHAGPPWARALVIDPETGHPAAPGETGVVRLFDLANLGSVLAIQTQDLAVGREDGTFELLGRDPAALPRGCSRAADEMLTL